MLLRLSEPDLDFAQFVLGSLLAVVVVRLGNKTSLVFMICIPMSAMDVAAPEPARVEAQQSIFAPVAEMTFV